MPDDHELPEEWQLANRLLDVHGPTRLGEMFGSKIFVADPDQGQTRCGNDGPLDNLAGMSTRSGSNEIRSPRKKSERLHG